MDIAHPRIQDFNSLYYLQKLSCKVMLVMYFKSLVIY